METPRDSGSGDPGWPPLRTLLLGFIPVRGARVVQRSDDALMVIRMAWIAFVGAMVIIGGIVLFLWSLGGAGSGIDGRTAAVVLVIVGGAVQVIGGRVVGALAPGSPREVARQAQTRFFLRIAFAEVGVIVGFLGFALTGNPAVYLVGFVVGAAGMIDAAPTAAHLRRQQAELRAAGSDVDLVSALTSGGLTR